MQRITRREALMAATAASTTAYAVACTTNDHGGEGSDVPDNVGSHAHAGPGTGGPVIRPEREIITADTIRVYGDASEETYADYDIADYADIGAAINQALSDYTAPKIILPRGSFSFSTDITISDAGTVLTGMGGARSARGTDLVYTGSGTPITVTGNAVLRGFRLDGNDEGGTVTGIDVQSSSIIDEVTVFATDKAVHVEEAAYYTSIVNSYLTDSTHGAYIESNHVILENTSLSGNGGVGAVGCTITTQTSGSVNRNIVLKNCAVESNAARGVYIESPDRDSNVITIEGCYFENNATQAIFVNDDTPNYVQGLTIRDNIIRGTTTGIGDVIIRGTRGGVFEGNVCNNFDGGVVVEDSTEEIDLRDEHLVTSSTTTFDVANDAVRCFIEGVGENAGDPSSAGDWNGNGREGVTVVDTTNNNIYIYRGGAWVT